MVKKSSKVNYENLAILISAILLALSMIINVSLAYFTDKVSSSSSSADIRFGIIAVDASGTGAKASTTFDLTASEVAMMDDVYKTIVLKNKTGQTSETFYLRMKIYYTNNGTVDNSKVKVNITSSSQATSTNYSQSVLAYNLSNWTAKGDYFYFNNKIDITNSQYIPLVISFDNTFGSEYLNNGKICVDIEIVQSANNGYTAWADRPSSWPKA